MIDKRKQGRINRQSGARFELKVREDLTKRGWIVSKYLNNLDIAENKIIPARPSRFRLHGTGFPDFVAFRMSNMPQEVIAVECKSRGYLSKEEKDKCIWMLKNNIFNRILVAKKKKEGRKIVPEYTDFTDFKIKDISKSINLSLKQASKGQIKRIA